MAGRRLDALTLTEAEKSELMAMASRPKTAQALAQRARIVLTCAEGLENKVVMRMSIRIDFGTPRPLLSLRSRPAHQDDRHARARPE
jgi:hypothetical protein